jgi:tRNA-dependent cyclodipeptide synthase
MIEAHVSNKTNSWKKRVSGTCYLGNSLLSKSHSEEYLESMVNWINEETNFKNVVVGLSDTLNRFTIQNEQNLSTHEAHLQALKLGDEWIEKNTAILKKLKKPFKFFRWDDWFFRNEDTIDRYKDFYLNLYNHDYILRSALHEDVNKFFNRRYGKSIIEMPMENFNASLEYLIEELAVYSCIFEKMDDVTAIYPANELKMLKAIRRGLVQGIPNTIDDSFFIKLNLQPVDVNFSQQAA